MVDTCVGFANKAILDLMVTLNKVFVQGHTVVAVRRAFTNLQKASVSFVVWCCLSYSDCATDLQGLPNYISCVNKSVHYASEHFECILMAFFYFPPERFA